MQLTVEQAQALYAGSDSVHDFDHILRVLQLAERIAALEGADSSVVRTAALLHDWGRAEAESLGEDHAAFAAGRARRFLQDAESAWVEAVVHAIAAHRFRTLPAPQTLEAQCLFDADKLDALGAVGVARAFAYGGAHNQRLWAPLDSVDRARWDTEGDDPSSHTPVHEFVVKLSRLKERLYTSSGRAIADERHRFMAAFFRRLDAEVSGEL
ncbi:MAG: HD domain-containing protein [Anaerolineae bacterium]|nr:HD domain-containing protein [Anaerolineae bacterium]